MRQIPVPSVIAAVTVFVCPSPALPQSGADLSTIEQIPPPEVDAGGESEAGDDEPVAELDEPRPEPSDDPCARVSDEETVDPACAPEAGLQLDASPLDRDESIVVNDEGVFIRIETGAGPVDAPVQTDLQGSPPQE